MTKSFLNSRVLLSLACLLTLLCCGSSAAAEKAKKAESAPADVTAPVAAIAAEPAPLLIFNRPVTVFRASLFGVSPVDRAASAKQSIERVLAKGGVGKVIDEIAPQGRIIKLDGELVFVLTPPDVDLLKQETLAQATDNAVNALTLAVGETREARNLSTMLRAGGLAALATIILLFLLAMLHRLRSWVADRLLPMAEKKSEQLRVGGEVIIHSDLVIGFVRRVLLLCYWLVTLLLFYEWLGYVLARFPYTRAWGERLTQYLVDLAGFIAGGILTTIPDLFIAFIIFLMAKGVTNRLNFFFDRVESGHITLSWLDQDTVVPTRRLVVAAIWLFTLAMAYPYLPGAQTEAFKGLSVLVGLMISLGASSVVGQAASGLILMFTRTMRVGEYVNISEKEGTVVELGLFNTRIRTGMGEELTLPNSLILSSVTKNYSRTIKGQGFVLSTNVTIGYDTPWRQIHAMLLEAAGKTEGVLSEPPPRVFQTALSDYYPEYRLVCQAASNTPQSRAEILTTLHANIQDVFNEYGVQIMSPHYMADPADAKLVAQENWYAPPAVPKSEREK
jgi:small-conductance mechanosensitive channel